jgi:2-dehydro-3-deoxyphosphogluconate aldolase/(4S)-4-hydroxy-2-oxoglutarate aldolase
VPTAGRPSISASIARIASLGILPVVEVPDLKQAEPLFEALCAGGLPAAEITLRTSAGLDAIRLLVETYPDGFVGAGTVRSIEDAAKVIDAGAHFVVSPATDAKLIAFCCERQVLVLPGICTPTEIQAALQAGADLLKFFPAEAMGGLSLLKALSGPYREVSFVPTGGINAQNLAGYLRLPQVTAVGGSWMVAPALLQESDFRRIQSLTAEAVAIVAQARGND